MLTPIVSTQAHPETGIQENHSTVVPEQFQPIAAHTLLPQFVLIPGDIYDNVPLEECRHLLSNHGFAVKERLKFMSGYDSDQDIKQYLQQQVWDSSTGIFILMEGWMVPLVDFLTYLGDLRSAVAADTLITIALVGRPAGKSFAAVSKNDYIIWQQKVTPLGDPYLSLFPLTSAKET